MLHHHRRFLASCLTGTALSDQHVLAQLESRFDKCKVRLTSILNGTLVYIGIDNETVQQYIYRRPIGGMLPLYANSHRDEFIAIIVTPRMWSMECHTADRS
jgi:hypothetical protein